MVASRRIMSGDILLHSHKKLRSRGFLGSNLNWLDDC